jgi:predicted PurR-regulated permease PerM
MAATVRSGDPSRAAAYAAIAALVAALALLAWHALTYVLLAFVGVLLALLLRAPADWLVARTRLPGGLALALVGALLLGLLGGAGYFFGHAVAEQTAQLGTRLPEVVDSIIEGLNSREWGAWLLSLLGGGEMPSGAQLMAGALGFAGSALEALTHLAIAVFLGIFLAAQPRLYVDGAVRLVPVRARERAREVLQAVGDVLQRWLVGQSILMVCIGVLTGLGLWAIGAPLALPLALLAGLLNFIPYVGPILAAVPAVLVGFSEGPQMALYIVLLFIVLQSAEGYVLEPVIQERAVFVPPALILFSQAVLGLVAGPLGIIVATPLAAALVVAVRMLYVEGVLERR